MSDIGSQLWAQYASLVQGLSSIKYDSDRDDQADEQILTMLVATPVEADWFGSASALMSGDNEDDSFDEVLRQVDEASQPQGSLSAVSGNDPDPFDIASLIDGDPPQPEDALAPAETDDDGQPQGRPDPAYAAGSVGRSVKGLTPGQKRFLDTMAFLPGQYNPLWAPGSVRAADAYKSLLMNISVGDIDDAKKKTLDKACDAFQKTTNGFQDIKLAAARAYNTYQAEMKRAGMDPGNVEDFLRDNGYDNKLSAALTKKNADNASFRQVVQDVGLPEDLIEAVSNVKSDIPQLFMMADVTPPPWNNPFSQESSHSESHTSFSKTTWGVEVSGAYDFITFGGEASGSHEHTTVSTSQIDIAIAFAGWREVPAMSGDSVGDSWFNGSVISAYVGNLTQNENNAWAKTSRFYGEHPKRSPYGPRGFLPFWPVGAIVVYQPSFTLTMKKTEYEKNSTSWSGGVSIGIGPFKFKPNASHSNITVDEEGDSMKVTMTDTSPIPKVLAMQMQLFPPSRQ